MPAGAERETFARAIAEIRKELPRFGRIDEELVARQAEDQRLGEMVLAQRQALNNVGKDLDERTRTLPYMVEQRAQDNKRIAQVQAEIVELLKRTDAVPGKLAILEERQQRQDLQIQKLQPVPDQLRREQQTFIEAQKLADAERCRQMDEWAEAFAEQRKNIETQSLKMREFGAVSETAQRAIKSLEEFQAGMLRDQKQLSELQRLAEERQRKEFGDVAGGERAALEKGDSALGIQRPGAAESQPEARRTGSRRWRSCRPTCSVIWRRCGSCRRRSPRCVCRRVSDCWGCVNQGVNERPKPE